jgi:hypothetical protein
MASQQFSVSALIQAPPHALYSIIADYHHGHVEILPRPPFVALAVEEGGVGDGTRIRVTLRLLGRDQTYRAVVSEPEPGRLLAETNENGYRTTFTVEPRADGSEALVTIATELPRRVWPLGAVERWIVARLLRPVYVRELELLGQVAATRAG